MSTQAQVWYVVYGMAPCLWFRPTKEAGPHTLAPSYRQQAPHHCQQQSMVRLPHPGVASGSKVGIKRVMKKAQVEHSGVVWHLFNGSPRKPRRQILIPLPHPIESKPPTTVTATIYGQASSFGSHFWIIKSGP